MAILSANAPRVLFEEVGKPDINKVYKVGPRHYPVARLLLLVVGQTFRFPLFGTDGQLDRI
jgi:hypothetical protein